MNYEQINNLIFYSVLDVYINLFLFRKVYIIQIKCFKMYKNGDVKLKKPITCRFFFFKVICVWLGF